MHQMHPFDLRSSTETRNPKIEVPYSDAALRQDLQRVRNLWDHSQTNRQRDAIYAYLGAVYALVRWWAADIKWERLVALMESGEGPDRATTRHLIPPIRCA
jgi:hypothetical protein